jgi:hypothetical protein
MTEYTPKLADSSPKYLKSYRYSMIFFWHAQVAENTYGLSA